jgi:hypothetical protein
MVPLARTGRRSAKVAVPIRAVLGGQRGGASLLALGALFTLGLSLTALCPMRPILAYASTIALAATSLGMLLGWSWARTVARIVCWVDVFLFAMLVVPDWDDAMKSGVYGLHTLCGVVAAYFLLCAVALGFGGRRSVAA